MDTEQIKSWDIIRSYLCDATPAQWHLFAARSNYDSNFIALRWLIDNPKTDLATVLMIYWNLGAGWFAQFSCEEESTNPEAFRLTRLIEERYSTAYYKSGNIWFDPAHSDGTRSDDYSYLTVKRPIPEVMLKPVNGSEYIEVECDPDGFDEGLPLEVVEALCALYDDI